MQEGRAVSDMPMLQCKSSKLLCINMGRLSEEQVESTCEYDGAVLVFNKTRQHLQHKSKLQSKLYW